MSFMKQFLDLSTGSKVLDAIFFLALAFPLTLFVTYSFTSVRFFLGSKHYGTEDRGDEPPTLPYWIPYIGHMFRMADLHGLLDFAA